jgi:hypothetical protein
MSSELIAETYKEKYNQEKFTSTCDLLNGKWQKESCKSYILLNHLINSVSILLLLYINPRSYSISNIVTRLCWVIGVCSQAYCKANNGQLSSLFFILCAYQKIFYNAALVCRISFSLISIVQSSIVFIIFFILPSISI